MPNEKGPYTGELPPEKTCDVPHLTWCDTCKEVIGVHEKIVIRGTTLNHAKCYDAERVEGLLRGAIRP